MASSNAPVPHASGALWVPDFKTVIIADAHLGYGWAQRRRGELGPVYDARSWPKLAAVLDELSPREVVFLGDLVHAPRPHAEERAFIEATLGEVRARAKVTVVRGNHDRAFARDFNSAGIEVVESWHCGPLIGVHGDRPFPIPEHGTVITGHIHPCLSVRSDSGSRVRVPVFLSGDGLIVLPAFSPYAAGRDLTRGLDSNLRAWFDGRNVEAIAATGKRLLKLGPLQRYAGNTL